MRKGKETREAIVDQALRNAVISGVEGVTLGPLAEALKLSKSGLFAHFRSKETLQIAVVEEAVERFRQIVVLPAMPAAPGLPRLEALFLNHLAWMSGEHEAGGCLFAIANQEYCERPGEIRSRLVAAQKEWLELLAQTATEAKARKQIRSTVDPDQLAFEMVGMSAAYQTAHRLLGNKEARRRAIQGFEHISGTSKV